LTPLISVVTPVFNAAMNLPHTIQSLLFQAHTNLEILLIDDGSTDGSPDIIRDFAASDHRIHPVFTPHRGIAHAMNTGIAAARGDYIAYLDHDDIALPERLANQLAWMQKFDLDICGSCVKRIGDHSNLMWFPEKHESICNELLFSCSLLQTGVMLRAEVAKQNPYNEQAVFLDYELWTRLATRYRMGNIQQVLTLYRSHCRQTSLLMKAEFREDLRTYREPLFYKLFPNASSDNYSALAKLIDKAPIESLDELEHAGMMLSKLTQSGDSFLNNKMARRWWDTCYRNAPLGTGCYQIYRKIASMFGTTSALT